LPLASNASGAHSSGDSSRCDVATRVTLSVACLLRWCCAHGWVLLITDMQTMPSYPPLSDSAMQPHRHHAHPCADDESSIRHTALRVSALSFSVAQRRVCYSRLQETCSRSSEMALDAGKVTALAAAFRTLPTSLILLGGGCGTHSSTLTMLRGAFRLVGRKSDVDVVGRRRRPPVGPAAATLASPTAVR
jgi:hypothetical protein